MERNIYLELLKVFEDYAKENPDKYVNPYFFKWGVNGNRGIWWGRE